jgi:nitrous oxidase accessory protein NosD
MYGRHRRIIRLAAPTAWRPLRTLDVLLGVFVAAVLIASGSFLSLSNSNSPSEQATAGIASLWAGSGLAGTGAPAPLRVCANKAVLGGGPTSAPNGAVTVPAGQDSDIDFSRPHTTYWFEPGLHTLGPGQYVQIDPGEGSVFIGAPGAVLDGQNDNYYAFGGYASDVTISYLTIENFGTHGGNQNQGAVNNDSATGWTVERSTITDNAGAGVMLGSHDTLLYDCLSDNQQYGFSAYAPGGVTGLVLSHNEIAGNDTYNYEASCGCSGGGKFWAVDGAVITDNYVHDNTDVGLWADTDNRGFDISGNYISGNTSYGLIYEISYNALISHNTFNRNGLVEGPQNTSFPTSAIYISESGGDSRVHSAYSGELSITDNSFTDNWSGVVLWENSNRFCNSPANTSSGTCTLVNPSSITLATCDASNLTKEPYYSDCRWKTQNVLVAHNLFQFDPATLGSECTPMNGCGLQGVFSEYGTYPSWSPYQGTIVEKHITFDQNNHFESNKYIGPWEFMVYQQGSIVTWSKWIERPYSQDQGSSLSS